MIRVPLRWLLCVTGERRYTLELACVYRIEERTSESRVPLTVINHGVQKQRSHTLLGIMMPTSGRVIRCVLHSGHTTTPQALQCRIVRACCALDDDVLAHVMLQKHTMQYLCPGLTHGRCERTAAQPMPTIQDERRPGGGRGGGSVSYRARSSDMLIHCGGSLLARRPALTDRSASAMLSMV
jgi:hypothetical protein